MAYTATISSPMNRAERISRSFGFFAGKCNITSYHTTLAEITGITRYFATGGVSGFTQGILAVIPQGVSDKGYTFEWDYTTGAFKCYKPTSITATALTIAVDSALSGSVLLFDSGGGAGSLHATSAVGNIVVPASAYSNTATEASVDDDCGEVGFIAIGFVR